MIKPKKENIPKILKVKKFRKEGMSFREIARALQIDVNVAYRWYMYDENKLSPVVVDR